MGTPMHKLALGPVVIVGTNAWSRYGIRQVAERLGASAAGEAESLEEAAAVVAEMGPALVVIDQRLRKAEDVVLCRALRDAWPSARILTLSWYSSERDWLLSLLAGASACLLMQVGGLQDLVEVIDRVVDGENLLHQQWGERLGSLLEAARPALTGPEAALLDGIVRLNSNAAIAAETGMSADDVAAGVAGLVAKLLPLVSS